MEELIELQLPCHQFLAVIN